MTKISVTKILVLDDKYRIAEKVLVVKLSVFSSVKHFSQILILRLAYGVLTTFDDYDKIGNWIFISEKKLR